MRVLVTGSNGFIGKNLVAHLHCDAEFTVLPCDVDCLKTELDSALQSCDVLVHLAGVNRSDDNAAFMQINRDFTELLQKLKQFGNLCPILAASSIQVAEDNPYGQSKKAMEDTYQQPVIYSTHPRSMKAIKEKGFSFHPLVRSLPPFGFFDYIHLQQNAFCVLSDSGTLSEESAMLGFSGVLIRTSTERPEVLEKGRMILGGIEEQGILRAVALASEMGEAQIQHSLPMDYRDENVAEKVAKIVLSYAKLIR